MLWIAFAIVAIAGFVDLRRREIPDVFPIALLACGVAGAAIGWLPWSSMVGGAALGFGLGALLFAVGAFGGGDAKLLAGIGSCLGPAPLLAACIFMGVAGGVFSCIALLRGARELAYAPAMGAGLLAQGVLTHWGGV